ncbi:4'-phosphopantetheinyl transferase family protein [Tellurirhabdus bombi]|uniref:4'-phosphopantetheinyl transferase family protein n=1 Tax=Tellurirhabdus bombi TaxID=2907205 RepID=UPI001F1BFD3B|nr:4'-phosphopantetheinyl transferase superfamily protein [Tellurirhabdus bombi]
MKFITVFCQVLPAINWEPFRPYTDSDELVLFRVQLSRFVPLISALQPLLRDEEIARAQRYHQDADRQRFVISRGVLRVLLGMHTGQPHKEIQLVVGANQKPMLRDFPAVHYSVSHSGDWILMALAKHSVGVDIEKINPSFVFQEVVTHSFGLEEQQAIEASADPAGAFYQLWTRKEALVKATGKGIDDDFAQIPSLEGEHSLAGDLLGSTSDLCVSTCLVATDYAAALAYPTAIQSSRFRFCTVEESIVSH